MTDADIPFYFFQTSTVCIDDDPKFLNNIKLQFSDCGMEIFSSFKKIKERCNDIKPLIHSIYMEQRECDDLMLSLHVNISNIKDIRNLNMKRSIVTSTVIDYNMPLMNGVEVATLLPDYIYKILLTGVADEKIAISAFNNGEINNFLKKQDVDIVSALKKQIRIAENKFFLEETKRIISLLGNEFLDYTLINNKAYKKLWFKLIEKFKIVEGYILNSTGSYLFFDKDGNSYHLHVQTQEQADASIDTIHKEDFNDEMIEMISKHHYLYIPEADELSLNVNIVKAECDNNKERSFYYGIIKNDQFPCSLV